jgi:hemerythrin
MLGHEAIDIDHLAIADCWLQAATCEQIQFAFLIARLKKLMRTHFDREVALMARAGGRLCECHRQEHRELLELCDRADMLSRSNWPHAQALLRNKFPKMVREHIICMDQLAVLFIHTSSGAAGRDAPLAS